MTQAAATRILLVDDNVALVENLTEILRDQGYEVESATTCAEARQQAEAAPFDVALIDVRLPDGDGIALARTLRDLQSESEVILLTGFATLETAMAAVRAGACAYLMKPCATPELLTAIEQAMRQVRLLREKRELARRAQMAEKLAAVGTLTAGLSHEIRNPLNAAALQLTVLERRVRKLPEERQAALLEPLSLVRDEVQRLDRILEDFLQFARPRDIEPRPVNVLALIERVTAFLAADAEGRGVRLTSELEEVPSVAGDEGSLQQALVNLVINAVQATPAGGRVRVSASQLPEGMVRVSVEDTGPGVPAELRERIFEPFFTTKPAGSGLGLSIVHSIIAKHGGELSLETGESGGARFVIRLPAT